MNIQRIAKQYTLIMFIVWVSFIITDIASLLVSIFVAQEKLSTMRLIADALLLTIQIGMAVNTFKDYKKCCKCIVVSADNIGLILNELKKRRK